MTLSLDDLPGQAWRSLERAELQLELKVAETLPSEPPSVSSVLDGLASLFSDGSTLTSVIDALAADGSLAPAGAALAVVLLLFARGAGGGDADDAPYPDGVYDATAAAQYFRRRPLAVAARAAELVSRTAGFGLSLGLDYASGKLDEHAPRRAAELTDVLTVLGPTFIKLGQSASIRSDLLPPAYLAGLARLQDKVPAFEFEAARDAIERELKMPVAQAFRGGLPRETVAAASLGQVYKAVAADGTAVAVKVQRPDMEETIALDMHLIRDYAAPLASLVGLPGELVETADEWGRGFVAELDYSEEARNAERFTAEVNGTELGESVFAPRVVGALSSRRILTTEWVEGERLDACRAPADVPRLCSVAMIAYLQMMLDSGTLHCDPHPGNLLRTPDGRLCILDWGLVTSIESDLQLTLIEHVAHLTAEDYAKVPSDLVKLGFVPAGGEDAVMGSGVVDFLTYTYSTWNSGGGAAKLDVPKLLAQVQELAEETPGGIFQVPPYFAYIAKAFSVLEGIGLSIDPNYSIVKETLPYISTRILTDPSPRTAGALATFVYGDAKDDEASRVFDAGRIETLIDGVRRYAVAVDAPPEDAAPTPGAAGAGAVKTAATAAQHRGDGAPVTIGGVDAEAAAEALLDLLLAPQPSPLQEIVVEQTALVLAAASREAWADLRARSPSLPTPTSIIGSAVGSGSGGSSGGEGGGGGGGGVGGGADAPRSLLGALIDPLGLFRTSRLVTNNERDREALAAARKLAAIGAELVASGEGGEGGEGGAAAAPLLSADTAQKLAPILARKVWERRSALPAVTRQLLLKLVEQTESRLAA